MSAMVRRFLLSLLIVLVVLLALMPVLVCGLLVSELARDPLAGVGLAVDPAHTGPAQELGGPDEDSRRDALAGGLARK